MVAAGGAVAVDREHARDAVVDVLEREESCGGHFRTEHQDAGEARRDDGRYAHVAVWEWQGEGAAQRRHEEPLRYEEVQFSTRSYK
ncbi:MAG: hypothetical protein ACKOQ9_08185 [Verrucomicrobiota bacterium]